MKDRRLYDVKRSRTSTGEGRLKGRDDSKDFRANKGRIEENQGIRFWAVVEITFKEKTEQKAYLEAAVHRDRPKSIVESTKYRN